MMELIIAILLSLGAVSSAEQVTDEVISQNVTEINHELEELGHSERLEDGCGGVVNINTFDQE